MAHRDTPKPLSHRAVETIKAGQTLTDCGENVGLRVVCGKIGGGTKVKRGKVSFIYRYRSPVTNTLKQIIIGHFPDTSLSEARVELANLKSQRARGVCPATARKERLRAEEVSKAEERAVSSYLMKDLVENYLTDCIEDKILPCGKRIKGRRKRKGQVETRRILERGVIDSLGYLPVHEVRRSDIASAIEPVLERGAKVLAGSILRELKASYEYALGKQHLPEDFLNPAQAVSESLKRAGVKLTSNKRSRVLSEQELVKLLLWLPESAYTQNRKNVLRMTLWTGCRSGDICASSWDQYDLKKGILVLQDTKNGTDQNVQLPRQAVEFLRELRTSTIKCPFPNKKTGEPIRQKTLTEQAWRMREKGQMLDIADWTPHDLRRTVRTGLSRLKCPSEVAEAVLGHAKQGIEGTYDLYSYEDECREWLQKWADFLDTLVS